MKKTINGMTKCVCNRNKNFKKIKNIENQVLQEESKNTNVSMFHYAKQKEK